MSQARHPYRLIFRALALFLVMAVQPAAPARAAGAPRWPLDLPAHWLTSNFMEYRGGRFHAGLDFKTREQEGFPAHAVEDGWIERVRVTPGGYGRAVYLRVPSGRTYVYAHLGRFNDRIGARVRAAQERDGAWRVELEFAPGELPVTRGEVLGLTGQSGTTGPHLHFEVRDQEGAPVDPQAAGFAVRDTLAPVIVHVRALPAAAGALVNGAPCAWRCDVTDAALAEGRLPPLEVRGPVAFSAKVVEATDPAGHRLEPWRLELRVDGQVVFARTNERFTFDQNPRQRLEWLDCGGVREQWLHNDPADGVAGREGGLWFGGPAGAGLAPGRHPCELVATDRAGNRAAVAWELRVASAAAPPGDTSASGWVRDAVEVSLGDNVNFDKTLKPLIDVLPEDVPGVSFTRVGPAEDPAYLAPVVLATVESALDTAQVNAAIRQRLIPASDFGVAWLAAQWPVDGAPLVVVPASAQPRNDVLEVTAAPSRMMYRWDGAHWAPGGRLLPPADQGGAWRLALESRGLYAVMRDGDPPRLGPAPEVARRHPGFRAGCVGVTPPRWEILAVPVSDAGSGVAPGSIHGTWDGQPIIVEPDLLRDRVLVEIPDATAAGSHVLRLTAADEEGRAIGGGWAIRCDEGPEVR